LIDRPHSIGDAAFGDWALLQDILEWGGEATLSWSSGNLVWLWEVLSANLPTGNWRAASEPDLAAVAAIHCTTDDNSKKVYQQLLSTGWEGEQKALEDGSDSEGEKEAEQHPEVMPRFTKEVLGKMTIEKLRGICQAYKIKQGKKKEQYVQNIFLRSETLHMRAGQVESLLQAVKSEFLPDPAPLHDFYRDYFNLVDLADRRWYSVEEHHKHHRWQSKMILSILRIATANTWVYVIKSEYLE
jgi:hypothetical protein